MSTTLKHRSAIFAAMVALAGVLPGAASAEPTDAGPAPAVTHVAQPTDLRSPDAQDAARGVSPRDTVVTVSHPSANDGFHWGDAGAGAGGAAAILLMTGGGLMFLRHRRSSTTSALAH
ncbi:MAG: hypothetical protein ACXVFN_07030 [Solirubrobacteraceae bacterium]